MIRPNFMSMMMLASDDQPQHLRGAEHHPTPECACPQPSAPFFALPEFASMPLHAEGHPRPALPAPPIAAPAVARGGGFAPRCVRDVLRERRSANRGQSTYPNLNPADSSPAAPASARPAGLRRCAARVAWLHEEWRLLQLERGVADPSPILPTASSVVTRDGRTLLEILWQAIASTTCEPATSAGQSNNSGTA